MTKTTLELRFQNAMGRLVRLVVPDPKQPVDPAATRQAMTQLVALGVFTSAGGDLIKPIDARLITTNQETWDMAEGGV
ncbi:MAG: DUF2922 domain-containing protein [Kyrpidia sp.]|nr:DUF2922 domain-containing protein [Kyrpidia sp.]